MGQNSKVQTFDQQVAAIQELASGPSVYRRTARSRGREVRRVLAIASCRDAVGTISPGCEIFGLTKGQYSLIDLIEHVLQATGPADVVISTWTAAGADLDFAMRLLSNGSITRCRFVVDFSFPRRQPEYCALLRDRFGDDVIRLTESHAKFVVVTNADWSICLRSSMNLNENRRLESWELSDDPGMAAYLLDTVESLFEKFESGSQFTQARGEDHRQFRNWFGDDINGRDIRRAGWTCQKTGKPVG